MSGTIQFNYNRFYKYYTKISNYLETENRHFNKKIWYYNDFPHDSNEPIETTLSRTYIRIHKSNII